MARTSPTLTLMACVLTAASAPADTKPVPSFADEIVPLLKERCVSCHGPAKQKGRLSLALPPAIVRGGENGPVISPGKPGESLLWKLVDAGDMPKDQPLRPDEKDLLRRQSFRTRQEARTALFDYLESFYNRERLHSTLGYRSPDEYERDHQERSGDSLPGAAEMIFNQEQAKAA